MHSLSKGSEDGRCSAAFPDAAIGMSQKTSARLVDSFCNRHPLFFFFFSSLFFCSE